MTNESAPRPDDELSERVIVDPDDHGFYFARVMQWIALHPEITHTAFRVYSVFRSLYTHKRDTRTLSRDQLRYLVPGVNGKPMGKTALNDALIVLAKFDLVSNPDGRMQTWRLRDPETQQFVHMSAPTWQLGTLPPEGDGFEGWRNVFDKLDSYPGPKWEKTAGQSHDRKTGDGAVAAPTQRPTDTSPAKTAGQSHDRKSGHDDRKSGRPDRFSERGVRKTGRAEPLASRNSASKNNKQEQLEELDQEHPGGLPPEPPAPAADAAGTNNSGNSASVITTQSSSVVNSPHAHARELAGVAACAAIDRDPNITQAELEVIIRESFAGELTQGQVVGRAASLLAWERKPPARRETADAAQQLTKISAKAS